MGDVVVFGIETCDQVRKARAWLRGHEIAFRFHDFRKDGLDRQRLSTWLGRVPWDSLLNRRGQAWRKLDPERRAAITDQTSAAELMLADPTLVKRPVLQAGDRIIVGFSETLYAGVFGTAAAARPARR
ncbi:MAG TPA: ArsC family reductase [Burkholderiaceae bacterium]|jgi:Spx/MgsR family transcriptional regulator|nr:ArsC family reductase [Burkholderiaceae bacterium]HRA77169.1 ArsC family reductase [Burkholderiaceae bacterium]